jgi:SNF2 family DNA or RNA helicase
MSDPTFITTPWEHQRQGVGMARHTPDLALFWEMGTGKTKGMIDILRDRYGENKRVLRTLILGPKIIVRNWCNEFGIHSKIKPEMIVPLGGTGKKRKLLFMDRATAEDGTLTQSRIFVTNYEAMEMDDLFKLILDWKPEVLICDESHRLKNHTSVRAKRVAMVADLAKHRYILTGTPILNSALDIFMQYRVLDGGETFGKNFFEFRGRFFEDENRGMPSHVHFPKFSPRPTTYQQLNDMIYRKALRVRKDEVLDLPPLVRQKIHVELGVEQKRMYDEMRKEYIAWVKSHDNTDEPRAVVAQMAITKALRLQQLVSGYAKTEDGAEVSISDNPRLNALRDLLEELTPGNKVIVWSVFHENYRQIRKLCDELGIGYAEIHGGISDAEKARAEDRFRSDPTCRVLIGNQRAGGIGINLVEYAHTVSAGASSYAIFYSRNFSLADDLQAEARNYRGGSQVYKSVTRIDLVASGTIDELGLEALASKQEIAEQVLAWKDKL